MKDTTAICIINATLIITVGCLCFHFESGWPMGALLFMCVSRSKG